jgi:hypothetical protein
LSDGKPEELTDAEKLAWLGHCSKIDNSGQDGGWAFEYMYMDLDNNVGPVDVRLAMRTYGELSKAVGAAMRYETGVGKEDGK